MEEETSDGPSPHAVFVVYGEKKKKKRRREDPGLLQPLGRPYLQGSSQGEKIAYPFFSIFLFFIIMLFPVNPGVFG